MERAKNNNKLLNSPGSSSVERDHFMTPERNRFNNLT